MITDTRCVKRSGRRKLKKRSWIYIFFYLSSSGFFFFFFVGYDALIHNNIYEVLTLFVKTIVNKYMFIKIIEL